MKQKRYKILSLLALSCGYVQARQILTTLPAYYAPYHYRLARYDDDCKDWYFDIQGTGYYRSADQAFSDCDGTCKVPFSTLLFGASDFTLAQAFAESEVGTALATNPFVTISTLTPRFDYNEHGAVFGFDVGGKFSCEKRWHAGFRARLPIREINVQEVCGGAAGGNDLVGETLSDVFRQRQETITVNDIVSGSNTVFAARLDFLTALQRIAFTTTGGTEPMVFYNDPAVGNRIGIAHQDVSGNISAGAGSLPTNNPIVAVIESTNGTVPESVRWGDVNTAITGVVGANGEGLVNLQRGRFAGDINYAPGLGTSTAAQSRLFVVPTVNDSGPNIAQTTSGSRTIQNAITTAILNLDESVTSIFELAGFDFCDGRTKGLGDLDLEFYIGYDWGCKRPAYTDFTIGMRAPTGKRICDCLKVLQQPLGNNGHTEVRIGYQMGWDATRWVKLKGDIFYSWVLKRTENIPAAFRGATIKNLGPCVPAQVSWEYIFANLDATFFTSECCGFDFGYQLYHKRCDTIDFCQTTATDLAGRTNQPLDASVAARLTEQTQHKLRAEFFLATGACEIFTGYDYAVAGKNAPVDSDFYLGMKVAF